MWEMKCFRKTLALLCCLEKTQYEQEQEKVLCLLQILYPLQEERSSLILLSGK